MRFFKNSYLFYFFGFLTSQLVVSLTVQRSDENVITYDINVESDTDDTDQLQNWWKTAVFYQIYPRSFKDSDGDGIGDLKGIIEKLPYLRDTGVTATWLSPIFKSPQVDQGYDISDYRDVDSIFGSLDDLRKLINTAHELGIKVILDFVPNHTSDQHEWFNKSVSLDSEYKDYYIWVNGTKGTPPNNWISSFKDSAWEWNADRKQYYYHQFSIAQPDLNYRNEKVVEAMKDVLNYWMDFGADGFRMDAVNTLFEIEDLRDEPLSNLPGYTSTDPQYLSHIYTTDQPETLDMIYQWRKVLDEYNAKNTSSYRIMMTEVYSSMEKTMLYFGAANGTTLGAHFSFNFNFITDITNPNYTVDDIITTIDKWQALKPKQYVSNWVLGNHDNHRAASRFGKKNVDGFNMLAAFLPGVMVTYNGEEIGMEDGNVTCEQGFDPQAIKNCTTYAQVTRDFERTPFQWDNSTNAGFSNATSTWLPVSSSYTEVNVAAQNVTGIRSHYHIYQELLNFRKNFTNITSDSLSLVKVSDNVLEIVRKTNKEQYIYLFNIADSDEEFDIFEDSGTYTVAVASLNTNSSVGELFTRKSLIAHESLILVRTYESSGSTGSTLHLSNSVKAIAFYFIVFIFLTS